jgi:spermidine synthase
VIPWERLGRARAPDGGELVLYRRDDEFVIRVDGRELMSSRAHGSEEELAGLACAGLGERDDARVLVGGLGLGYTLRAALDRVGSGATVVVAEIVPQVVEWNLGPLADLARRPLEDPRVEVHVGDVGGLLRATRARFDAIILDVDNGPVALTRKANQVLYGETGLALAKRCLRGRGALAVWSAAPDARFEKRLRKAGFRVEVEETPARGRGGGPMHTIFVGRLR